MVVVMDPSLQPDKCRWSFYGSHLGSFRWVSCKKRIFPFTALVVYEFLYAFDLYDQCSKRKDPLQDTHLEASEDGCHKDKTPPADPARDWKLRSVTVSRELSGNIVSLLFCCENQTVEKKQRFLGIDFAMQGMCVFSQEKEPGILCFTEKQRKLARNRESSPTVKKEAVTIRKQKKLGSHVMKR